MRKVNVSEIEEEPWQSPRGKYAASFKGISLALGRDENSTDLAKRHPFDLEITRVPPGKMNFPYGGHSAQWEMYLVISGNGTVRDEQGTTDIQPGDAFLFPPTNRTRFATSVMSILFIMSLPITPSVIPRITRTATSGRCTAARPLIGPLSAATRAITSKARSSPCSHGPAGRLRPGLQRTPHSIVATEDRHRRSIAQSSAPWNRLNPGKNLPTRLT